MKTVLMIAVGMLLPQELGFSPQAQNGVATGRLRSTNGSPASGVRVAAMAVPDAAAPGGGALVSLAETDASGRFRLENIPPGRYYIQAGLIDAPSYYPGVTTLDRATAIAITAGGTVEGLDFPMARPPGVRVWGRVPLNASSRAVMVSMTGGSGSFTATTAGVSANGTFEFLRVPPGSYRLNALGVNGLPPLSIIVADKDVALGLPDGPGVKVSGSVGLGPKSPRPAGQRVVFSGPSAWAQAGAIIDDAGHYEVPNVPPGTYTVT